MIAAFVLAFMLQTGTTSAAEATENVVHSVVERGPVKVTVSLSPKAPRLSDELELTIEIDADEKVSTTLPPLTEQPDHFLIRSFDSPLSKLENGRRIERRSYRLEPVETGKLTIPSFTIACADARAAGEAKEFKVESDPLAVTVESMLANQVPTLDAMKPPEGALRVEVQSRIPWRILGGIGGVLALVLAVFLLKKRRQPAVELGPPPTPVELARREFESLIAASPLARGELQTFYSELTLIVRRYIERTSGVRAPEQTTEEFLREMRKHSAFDSSARERLKAFLESADLVKFAGIKPRREDIEESFRRAQEFTDQVAPLALPAEVAA